MRKFTEDEFREHVICGLIFLMFMVLVCLVGIGFILEKVSP